MSNRKDRSENYTIIGGKYGIPEIEPLTGFEPCEFIGFNYAMSTKERAEKAVHFYLDDYQFQRIWNRPERYVPILRQYKYVCSPDYSLYADMPEAVQIYNHYRKHRLAAYWQSFGIKVIPTICWSTPKSFEWCFDGEPINSIVTVSSVGCMRNKDITKAFIAGYNEMMKRLEPTKVIFYGKAPDGIDTSNIILIEAFQSKYAEMKENKKNVIHNAAD